MILPSRLIRPLTAKAMRPATMINGAGRFTTFVHMILVPQFTANGYWSIVTMRPKNMHDAERPVANGAFI